VPAHLPANRIFACDRELGGNDGTEADKVCLRDALKRPSSITFTTLATAGSIGSSSILGCFFRRRLALDRRRPAGRRGGRDPVDPDHAFLKWVGDTILIRSMHIRSNTPSVASQIAVTLPRRTSLEEKALLRRLTMACKHAAGLTGRSRRRPAPHRWHSAAPPGAWLIPDAPCLAPLKLVGEAHLTGVAVRPLCPVYHTA
jgi:hypothetical protein